MKRTSLALILLGLVPFAANQLGAYTWTVTNDTNLDNVSVEVCTTLGIENCQTKTLKKGENQSFEFSKWYNTGLCLGQVKVNGGVAGIPTPEWFKSPTAKNIVAVGASLLMGGLPLVAMAIRNYCTNGNLGISMDNQKPVVYNR